MCTFFLCQQVNLTQMGMHSMKKLSPINHWGRSRLHPRFQAVPSAMVIMLYGSASVVIVGPEGISTGTRGTAESYCWNSSSGAAAQH